MASSPKARYPVGPLLRRARRAPKPFLCPAMRPAFVEDQTGELFHSPSVSGRRWYGLRRTRGPPVHRDERGRSNLCRRSLRNYYNGYVPVPCQKGKGERSGQADLSWTALCVRFPASSVGCRVVIDGRRCHADMRGVATAGREGRLEGCRGLAMSADARRWICPKASRVHDRPRLAPASLQTQEIPLSDVRGTEPDPPAW